MKTSGHDAVRPSVSVREIATQDGAVLLDIQQGVCLSLTPVAAKIWHLVKLNRSPKQIAESLISGYPDAQPAQVYADVSQFIKKLDSSGLLESRSEPRLLKRPKFLDLLQKTPSESVEEPGLRFLFWKALLGLLVFDLCSGSRSFNRLHETVRTWPVASVHRRSETIEKVCKAVRYAALCYPKRVLCLQRSAVTTCLLRHCGVPAKLAVGARKFPFKAHAWTEVDGRPINERRDVRQVYWIWERC